MTSEVTFAPVPPQRFDLIVLGRCRGTGWYFGIINPFTSGVIWSRGTLPWPTIEAREARTDE